MFREGNNLRLAGNVTDVTRGLYEDHQDRITVWVEGAEPLYAELRLPNAHAWAVGQRVVVVIMPISEGNASESLT